MSLYAAAAILGSAALSSAAQLKANQDNLDQAQANNDLSVNLANTQHQREVADLKAAGLNPILSASGSGAAVPTLGVADQKSIAESLPGSARELARYASSAYRQSVVGQQLSNDYQHIVNSAAESERATTALSSVNSYQLAALENEALARELGAQYGDGWSIVTDDKQHDKMVEYARNAIRSDLKLRGNSNWRANLSSFIPFVSPTGINSAAASAQRIKFLLK